jgi:hypothetical protein
MPTDQSFNLWRELLSPAIFTLFGATIGFVASQVRDGVQARRAKRSFLLAVGMELEALQRQLEDSLGEVTESRARLEGGSDTGPQFAAALRTSVFTSQVSKVRDVDDPLMIDLIHFYSDLGMIDRVLTSVNQTSAEYSRTQAPSAEKNTLKSRTLSGLRVSQEQLARFISRSKKMRERLATL